MMGSVGCGKRSVSVDTCSGALLKQLEIIWTDIGETEAEKDHMILELEQECMNVYRRKVDEANNTRARLHQTVVAKEAELAALRFSLGENAFRSEEENKAASLKEQLACVTPLLEELKTEKEERLKLFSEVRSQIEKITGEIAGYNHLDDSIVSTSDATEEQDLSLRKLNEYQSQLRALEKEKADRLHKVLEYVNEVHCLCGVLGIDFGKTVNEVHPSLQEASPEKVSNISNSTLDGLTHAILKLKTEKKARIQKLRSIVASLYELWNLMDSSDDERRCFGKAMVVVGSSEEDIKDSGILSLESFEKAEAEVVRLTKLKAGRMKELVFEKRAELEEICRQAHIEPDMSTAPEKASALIDSGIVDPSELLTNIEAQILKVKEELLSRKDIMDRIAKWITACEEEKWLEDYNQDDNRYNAGRGAHLNLKRAERARVSVTKIPGMVTNLMSRAFAWENEKQVPFMYDGIRLVSLLEKYKHDRQQKEEENKRYRDQKKLNDMLLAEKEARFGSRPSPTKSPSFNKKTNGYHVNGNGSMTPAPRRRSLGSATPELLTPRSCSGHHNGYFKESRKLSTVPLNFVALSKDEQAPSLQPLCISEQESPQQD